MAFLLGTIRRKLAVADFCVAAKVPVCFARAMRARFEDQSNARRARSLLELTAFGNKSIEICQHG
jgi:hypothetical protein